MSLGYYYIATGEKLVKEATLSAKSLQKHTDKPIAIATNEEVHSDIFSQVIDIESPNFGYGDKVDQILNSPWDKTIYLDTDIQVEGTFDPIFNVLRNFDVAVTIAHNRSQFQRKVSGVPNAFREFSTGVIAFNMSETGKDLMERWQSEYQSFEDGALDQPAFRKALFESPNVRIAPLPREYNLPYTFGGYAAGEVKGFHGRLVDHDEGGATKRYSVEHAVEKINYTTRPRVFFHSHTGEICSVDNSPSLTRRVAIRLRQQGLKQLAGSVVKKIPITRTN